MEDNETSPMGADVNPLKIEENMGHSKTTNTKKSWATRNGLNLVSFTPHEDHNTGSAELERSMKPRHLNMIAIGGRSVLPKSFVEH